LGEPKSATILTAMQSQTIPNDGRSPQKNKAEKKWRKVRPGLYRSLATGTYRTCVRFQGRLYRENLRTKDLQFAKRLLVDFRRRLERTDAKFGRITLAAWLQDVYFPTLRGSVGTLKAKQRIIDRVKTKWLQARTQPMRDLRESQVLTFLNENYGHWSHSHWNGALTLLRDALGMAVRDHALLESPAAGLKYRKRKKPIRLTPTWEQFQAIVADIRSQVFNGHDAEQSGDFIEFLGLAGLGQAEAAAITRADVDLDAGRVIIYRHKTDTGFVIPVFPQVRPLLEKLCEGKNPNDRLFKINQARAALGNACQRLGFPRFSHRSLRRMFIVRAIERGVDVKVIAQWQGHRDGGKLILDTYSHVRPEHSNRMAQLMSDEAPANVVPMHQAS
jgi:integrase